VTAQTRTTAKYRIVWHYDRVFEVTLNVSKRTLQFGTVLPDVPPRSPIYRELKTFVEDLQSDKRPDHRRVDPVRAQLGCSNRRGSVVVAMTVASDEFEYGTRKLIHAVNEIFMIFLRDGRYSEYI
jgi:hypothetical protein